MHQWLTEENVISLHEAAARLNLNVIVLLNLIVEESLEGLRGLARDDIEFIETVGGSHPEQPPEEVNHVNG